MKLTKTNWTNCQHLNNWSLTLYFLSQDSGTSGKPLPDPVAPALLVVPAVLAPLVPVFRALLAPVSGHVGRVATRTVVKCATSDCKTSGWADITCEIEIYQIHWYTEIPLHCTVKVWLLYTLIEKLRNYLWFFQTSPLPPWYNCVTHIAFEN